MHNRASQSVGDKSLNPLHFRLPAVRHLAWMAQAPALISGERVFRPHLLQLEELRTRLQGWDAEPAAGPPLLTAAPHPRLGLYFENLYACFMQELMGWELLARNLPVRENGRTLGELDFLFRCPQSGVVEHHEIAVKFYLGYPQHNGPARWYGPNARDRLDIKLDRLLSHQCPLSALPQTSRLLEARGIPPEPRQRIFMPGYLYYPWRDRRMESPPASSEDHLRGHWLRVADLDSVSMQDCVPLYKPHWLGPWRQSAEPDPVALRRTLDEIVARQAPRMLARMLPAQDGNGWWEQERFFVVPDDWPRVPDRNPD